MLRTFLKLNRLLKSLLIKFNQFLLDCTPNCQKCRNMACSVCADGYALHRDFSALRARCIRQCPNGYKKEVNSIGGYKCVRSEYSHWTDQKDSQEIRIWRARIGIKKRNCIFFANTKSSLTPHICLKKRFIDVDRSNSQACANWNSRSISKRFRCIWFSFVWVYFILREEGWTGRCVLTAQFLFSCNAATTNWKCC